MAYNNQSGYGQPNRYEQQGGNPYAQRSQNYAQQQAANPYAQQNDRPGGYGGQAGGRYNDEVEMGAVNGGNGAGYGQQQQRRDDPMAILNECRNIDNGVEQILKNLERLQYLQQQSLDDPDASQNTSTNRQLDSLSSETMTLYRSFVDRIRKLKGMPGAGSPQNSAQVGRVDRKLKDAIQRYQTVDADFRKKLQAQMARQYRIVRPDASESEVREATEDTSSNQVFSQALLQSDRRGQSQSALRAVQGRHEAIQKIEQQVIELAQLFQDMNELVVQQEAVVQQIDHDADQVHQNVVAGNEQLGTAVTTAYATRRKKWICLGISILIILILAGVIAVAVKLTQH